ncbi:conserved hypothetical protein [Trichinella spiralis]|uniref:hypothetical protein n=1 Tax=Trichinella spiralis TaxID=6334 RepID=UPI0001EFCBAC|nr:conserved hypothetical protein [Trichinella spiralis]
MREGFNCYVRVLLYKLISDLPGMTYKANVEPNIYQLMFVVSSYFQSNNHNAFVELKHENDQITQCNQSHYLSQIILWRKLKKYKIVPYVNGVVLAR